MEVFITGYCRCLDKSRMVLVEDGEADCEFVGCPHAPVCDIAKRIREVQEENK